MASTSKWTWKRMHLKLVDLFKEINEELLCSKIGLTIERVNLVEDNQHTHSTDRDFVTISQYSTAAVCTVSKDRGLYIKDRNLISDLKFSNVLKQFGVDINVLAFRQEINEVLKADTFKVTNYSYFVNVKKMIHDYCRAYLQSKDPALPHTSSAIRVKLSADGTNVGRNITVVNFTIQLIDTHTNSVRNVKTIGLAECSEDYEQLSPLFHYLMGEIKDLKHIQHADSQFAIDYFFVADMKLVRIVTGLNASNSIYCCIWCHWKKPVEESDKRRKKRVVEGPNGKRTEELRHEHIGKTHDFGYKRDTLLTCIPLNNILVEPLHMKMRICDKMLKQLIRGIALLDNFQKGSC